MGTDIRAYVEFRQAGKYWMAAQVHLGFHRDYMLFGLLAGVRGRQDAVVAQRGLPSDADLMIRLDYDEQNCHSPSWLDAAELEQVLATYRALTDGYAAPRLYGAALAMMMTLGDDARLTFWFSD